MTLNYTAFPAYDIDLGEMLSERYGAVWAGDIALSETQRMYDQMDDGFVYTSGGALATIMAMARDALGRAKHFHGYSLSNPAVEGRRAFASEILKARSLLAAAERIAG